MTVKTDKPERRTFQIVSAYEMDDQYPELLYDRTRDFYLKLQRVINKGYEYSINVYEHPLGHFICTQYDKVAESYDIVRNWYGEEVIQFGYVINLMPAGVKEVAYYVEKNLPKHIEDGEEQDLVDEYFSSNQYGPDQLTYWPYNYDSVRVYANRGNSEGHYVNVQVVKDGKTYDVMTAKTFRGFDHAWTIAREIARLLEV